MDLLHFERASPTALKDAHEDRMRNASLWGGGLRIDVGAANWPHRCRQVPALITMSASCLGILEYAAGMQTEHDERYDYQQECPADHVASLVACASVIDGALGELPTALEDGSALFVHRHGH